MSAAAKATKTPLSKISQVCNGKQKTSNGFNGSSIFKFFPNYN